MGVKDRPQCYFDVELNREPVGRIVFQLFSDVCPKTSKNFLCLCTGEKGTGKLTGKKLCFKGSTFHRVVKNFMVQGGDFTEGNGRGGESIYGGYFEDENFLLKHDKAYLLSMANRGKDTNGSQFFITTKMAPHLDGVHVVFGSIISGFEVIKKVEGLKTDSSSRPYADVRVMDCGQLFTKSANDVLEGKRKRSSHSADSSVSSHDSSSQYSSSENESDEKHKHHKHKRHAKSKRSKRRRRESKQKESVDVLPSNQSSPSPVEEEVLEVEVEVEVEQSGRREKLTVRPEEIPPVPENRFLLRRDVPPQDVKAEIVETEETCPLTDPKPSVSKSGRKIKGRGTMRYHTPTMSKSRSASVEERGSSETPPHWKEEMKRTKVYQPPSIERWSKGDKWENKSDSAWSRSADHSSDRGSERSSLQRQPKKVKKKSKHKKKSKKGKHGKKKSSKNKPPEPLPTVSETPVSSERKSKRSRSSSNQRDSSTQRKLRSSLSFRDSRSYSRSSYSQSRSRGRSYSRSRSLSRSLSRSRSRSYSRSRSRSRYRSSSRKNSLSPRKRKGSKPKAAAMMPEKLPDSKAPPLPRLPSVPASESTPVIPMSDSPPPSRWKPGQKPWKPSYVQEVKEKAALGSSSGPTVASVTEKAQTAVTPKCLLVDSEVHKRSRSYSRSRSRSYSRSSSYSGSDSETSQKAPSNKRNSLDKEWKEYYSSLKRVKNVDKYISHASSQDAKSGSNSPDVSKRSQDQEGKQFSSMPAESFNSRSEWDSDTERGGNSGARTKKQKRAVQSRGVLDKKSSAWNSESDSDHVTARNLAISEKEEGEASSESEFETSRKASEEVSAPKITKAAAAKGPEEVAEKHKSKKKSKRKRKHKRRRESRKEKGKRSKRKHQKLKETFHWQPPLEFGEEEDEDESKREKQSPGRVLKEKPVVEKITSNPKEEKIRVQQRAKECINKNSKHTESLLQPSNRNGADVPIVKQQESLDDMDICTPEHDAEIVQPTDLSNNAPEFILKPTSTISDNASPQSKDPSVPSSAGLQDETPGKPPVINFKWRPLKGTSAPQNVNMAPVSVVNVQEVQNASALGVKMEIKSQSRVRPGSLFDEVRKTARLNQRPRNEESSSEERSPSAGTTRSPKKSRSRGWSRSSSRSRSRSRSSSYSSRSRSRSRRRRRRGRSRSRSTTYRRSHSRTYSRSRSRSRSRHRRRRSRSDSYDSYSSRSRSASRRRGRRRSRSSRSSERRSRSSRSSSRSSSSSRYS
ncbi:NK-tumor recognition protein isoform X2 [Trematomus bernacchii]|uniref:NK-tumor recognition protein isoform X2 n=1 Tax=Trematomus bernacchii TaxID=40690 RepID=UPI00146A1689|nr:NK-tumor recognition protein isoform X2 [Trematomus bernacchii]